ncbi:hypothetical protein [Bacillus sp. REN10]|uniref:hypothetical protein n=1 Tax=Bacillus sp. REN10 TaxID=2782541 RepID=UPI00193AE91C|nr:hypothetical protein [Bacillus sp. REN10]
MAIESFIIAIVIGLIVNIFKRFSDREKDKRSPGPVAHLPETNRQTKQKKTVRSSKPLIEETRTETVPPFKEPELRIGSGRRERLEVQEEKHSSYEMEEDDLLKGIIFSQVIGPPKARRRK